MKKRVLLQHNQINFSNLKLALGLLFISGLTACGGGGGGGDTTTPPDTENAAPVAPNVNGEVVEDTPKPITLPATDEDGDALTYSVVSQPTQGILSVNGDQATYTPAANYNGNDSFTYQVNDGETDSTIGTVSITVTAVNDAPIANAGNSSTQEDIPVTVPLSATDVDSTSLSYAIASNPQHGAVSLNGNQATYTPTDNYNGIDSFTFTASDGSATSTPATISLSIGAVADLPVLLPFSGSVNENASAGTTVGSITINSVGDSAITAITLSGTGSNNFSVGTSGNITVKSGAMLDYETTKTYNLSAQASNAAGAGAAVSVVIAINNVADVKPVLANFTGSVSENASAGTTVGTITISSAGDSAITSFTLSGIGNGNFAISNTGQITIKAGATLDYETTPAYNLSIIATNAAGNSAAATATINVTNVADSTSVLASFSGDVDENANAGTAIGSITISESGDSAISAITLSGSGNENFAVNTSGQITVAAGATLDYETTSSYSLTAIASNAAGDSASVSVTIALNDLADEVPTLASFSGDVDENANAGTAIGSITINESGDSAISAITLSGSGNENFAVNTSGQITVAAGATLDYETMPAYNLTAIATNAAGDSAAADVSISLNDTLETSPTATGKLNDTGITLCGDYAYDGTSSTTVAGHSHSNSEDCANNLDAEGDPIPPGQDATHGRDSDPVTNDDSDGHKGFSFTKLDANGVALADQAGTNFSCVKDNVTGLIWEVKTDDGGLHDKDDRYNWYNTDNTSNGGSVGYADDDGNICHGYDVNDSATYCNTEAYVARVNASNSGAGLCGATDWRMPTREELRSIVSYDRFNPAIDSNYFPNTRSSRYWSSSPLASPSYGAWRVYFGPGFDSATYKSNFSYVRLVRSGQ